MATMEIDVAEIVASLNDDERQELVDELAEYGFHSRDDDNDDEWADPFSEPEPYGGLVDELEVESAYIQLIDEQLHPVVKDLLFKFTSKEFGR